jgi:glycosyltransferase involved in cell wall biosynthesis
MNKSISIIIPVYNAEEYLNECINSILQQSFSDFQIVLVNDGSDDGSLGICQQYAETESRITLINQDNQGVTAARKAGWENSTGTWLMFVDADDYLAEDALQILIQQADIDDYDIVNASFEGVPATRKWIHRKIGAFGRETFIRTVVNGSTYAALYATLYKTELFRDSTFAIGEDIKIGEGVLTKIELGSRANRILNTSNIVYFYRDNQASVMNTKIRHPSYFDKFYSLLHEILEKENFYPDLKITLERDKTIEQIKAFFDPAIPYEESHNLSLRNTLRNKELGVRGTRMTLYVFLIKHKYLTRIFKLVINVASRLRNLLRHKNKSKQVVIR